jgi:hypothetical protein
MVSSLYKIKINSGESMSSVYKLIPQLAELMKTMSNMSQQDNNRLQEAFDKYRELSESQSSWMNWKGNAILVCALLGGITGAVGALAPVGANWQDLLKTAGTAFPQIGHGVEALIESPMNNEMTRKHELENLIIAGIKEARSNQDDAARKANDTALGIIAKKNR